MRALAIPVAAIALAGCQSSTAPTTGTFAEAQALHRTLIETVKTCWFSGDPTFMAYVYSPEINAATPRILIVPKDDPLALPLLVIETKGAKATVFGPLLATPAGARISGDIDRWNRGGTACA